LAGGLYEHERELGETAQNLAGHEKEIVQLYEQERAALLKERELRRQKEEKLCQLELELIEMKKRDQYLKTTLKEKHKELKMEKLLSEARDKELQDLYDKRKRLEDDLLSVRHTQRNLELESSKKQEQIELRKRREAQLQEAREKAAVMESEISQVSGKYRDLLERYEKERDAKLLEREERLRKDKELEMARVKSAEIENAQRVAFEKEYARMLETRRRLEEDLVLSRQRLKKLEDDARVKEKETAELGHVREKVKTLSSELEDVVGKFGELEVRAERERRKKEEERERRLEREKKLKALEAKVEESEKLNRDRLFAERRRWEEAMKIAEQKEYEGIRAKEKFHEVVERTEQLQRDLRELGDKSKKYEELAGRTEQGKVTQRREVIIEKEQDVELEGREQGHKYH